MAAFRRLQRHWRKAGHCHIQDTYVVHLHFFFNDGLSTDHLYDTCILDEHQAVYLVCKTKPPEILISRCLNLNTTIPTTKNS
jgi:hypothetical protein